MEKKYIIINSNDNCATTLEDLPQDEEVEVNELTIKINYNIPIGHKFALEHINKGDYVIKYGEIIGIATKNIKQGDWIHTHNIRSAYLEGRDDR